jgi:transposase
MSRGRTPMRRIRQVLEYRLGKKISAEQTARALSLSKGSVINIIRRFERSGIAWPLPEELTDSVLEASLFAPEPSTVDSSIPLPDIPYLMGELARPHVTLQRLWEEYHEQHPDGLQRTAFYRYVHVNRPPEVSLKMVHKAGDKIFVDYSGEGLEYIDRGTGEVIPTELFASAWGASSYSYFEATRTQRTEDFVQSQVRMMEYFGVVAQALVPDNLKSGVKKADRYDPVANPLYERMASHYGMAILPARIRKPKDKAVAESAVQQGQRFILARLRNRQFFSLEEMNAAIREEMEVLNNRPMKDYGGQSRRERFLAVDKPAARPLPAERFKISKLKLGVRVGLNYHIRFEDHNYSIPYHLAGQCVDVYQVGAVIEIYHDNIHVCRHQAGPPNFGHTTVDAHMPAKHVSYVRGLRPEWFLHQASQIGPATEEAVRRAMACRRHPQQGFNAAQGILRMAKVYTPQRLEKACQRLLHFKAVSFRTLKTILEQSLDQQTCLPLTAPPEPPLLHENLRGPGYYLTA